MEFEIGYMTALIVIGIGFLLATLAMMVDEVNRKKGIIAGVLAAILICAGGYSYAVVAQWQRAKGEPSLNKFHYYLHIYRPPAPPSFQEIPLPGPGAH